MPELTARLTELTTLLGEHQAPEPERWDGWRPDIPGRAMPLLPPYVVDGRGEGRLHGRVTFTRFYLGGNGAAHGGAHTLLFDDVMGNIAGPGRRHRAHRVSDDQLPADHADRRRADLRRADGRGGGP